MENNIAHFANLNMLEQRTFLTSAGSPKSPASLQATPIPRKMGFTSP